MFSELLHRGSRRNLLIEFNPHQVLAAGISEAGAGTIEISCAAEFDRLDDAGLRAWLDANGFSHKSWSTAICGLSSSKGLLHREIVQPHKLAEPDYVATILREECKIGSPEHWITHILNPLDGTPLSTDSTSRPALVCGLMKSEVRGLQERLFEHRLTPASIEPALLPLFGSLFRHLARQGDKRSAVVLTIEDDETVAYVLGKEGVYAPSPVRQGLRAVMRALRTEIGLADENELRERLRNPDDMMLLRAAKLVRGLGRELKPLVDSSEMSTGQPVGGIYFAYLPPNLAWIAEPLAKVMERPLMAIDCNEWLPSFGLRTAPGIPPFGAHWLGALSLVGDFSGSKLPAKSHLDEPHEGPWHVDCRIAAEQQPNQFVGRRFVDGAIAAAFAICLTILTVWQLYVTATLRTDTATWEAELGRNQALFGDLTRANAEYQALSNRLNQAYELAASPFQVSDFVINLGRTLPANMRIDRVESAQGRISISGGLREPSDSAGGKLNRYLEDLRRSPAIGPLFSTIGLTALQRDDDPEWLVFEITFRPKPLQP